MLIDNINIESTELTATVNFNNKEDANEFALAWSRKTMMGHTVSGNSVSVYNVTSEYKDWIDSWINPITEFDNASDEDILNLLFA